MTELDLEITDFGVVGELEDNFALLCANAFDFCGESADFSFDVEVFAAQNLVS